MSFSISTRIRVIWTFLSLGILFPILVFAQENDSSRQFGLLNYSVNPNSAARYLPNISVIGSFAAGYFSIEPIDETGHNPARTGFTLQEIEVAFQSIIDPYFLADVFLVFGESEIEIEEAYLTAKNFLTGFSVKIGKVRLPFGRHNTLHLEQWNFIDSPLIHDLIFGPEGLIEIGLQLNYIFPTPFYLALKTSVSNGDNEESFAGAQKQDLLYQGRIEAGHDLSSTLSFLWGGSYAYGFNDIQNGNVTQLFGGDLVLKWNPKPYRQLVWQTEYLWRKKLDTTYIYDDGLYSYLNYQFAKRWETGFRWDHTGFKSDSVSKTNRYTPVLTFNPTEYSRIRVQYSLIKTQNTTTEHSAFLQFQFVMGPHGTHPY